LAISAPLRFLEKAKARRNGSNQYQNSKALEGPTQQAYIMQYLTKLFPKGITPSLLLLYDLWEATEYKLLPKAGGLLDQPAALMNALLDLRTAYGMGETFWEIDEQGKLKMQMDEAFFSQAASKQE
jgi:hypothetical protein